VIIAAIRNVAGAFAGTAVAKWWVPDRLKQLGHQVTVISARLSAIIWDLITWHFGLPTSSSYATLSSLAGAAIATAGTGVVITKGVIKILLGLFISPITGLLLGFLLMHLLALIFRRFSRALATKIFNRSQVVSAAYMAFSHGNNDAQKTMGIITMALVSYHQPRASLSPSGSYSSVQTQ
jgi:PiT family inorganic phosphate transporter